MNPPQGADTPNDAAVKAAFALVDAKGLSNVANAAGDMRPFMECVESSNGAAARILAAHARAKADELAASRKQDTAHPAATGEGDFLPDAHNWTEDFSHENGGYFCICRECRGQFMGHKRRQLCKVCANLKESSQPPVADSLRETLAKLNACRETLMACERIAGLWVPANGRDDDDEAYALVLMHRRILKTIEETREEIDDAMGKGEM
jgi:hypothetical protein